LTPLRWRCTGHLAAGCWNFGSSEAGETSELQRCPPPSRYFMARGTKRYLAATMSPRGATWLPITGTKACPGLHPLLRHMSSSDSFFSAALCPLTCFSAAAQALSLRSAGCHFQAVALAVMKRMEWTLWTGSSLSRPCHSCTPSVVTGGSHLRC
jgi:hypothetical protein